MGEKWLLPRIVWLEVLKNGLRKNILIPPPSRPWAFFYAFFLLPLPHPVFGQNFGRFQFAAQSAKFVQFAAFKGTRLRPIKKITNIHIAAEMISTLRPMFLFLHVRMYKIEVIITSYKVPSISKKSQDTSNFRFLSVENIITLLTSSLARRNCSPTFVFMV